MRLELKHIAPYLPYGLKWALIEEYDDCKEITTHIMCSLSTDYEAHDEWWNLDGDNYLLTDDFKPILRPLTDLTNDIFNSINRDSYDLFVNYDTGGLKLTRYNEESVCIFEAYKVMKYLFKNHFDVFGLIEKGLAIDINTLEK